MLKLKYSCIKLKILILKTLSPKNCKSKQNKDNTNTIYGEFKLCGNMYLS